MIHQNTDGAYLRIGYVIAFSEISNTISIKTFEGVTYDNVQLDQNIASMPSPVVSSTTRSGLKTEIMGSLVWYVLLNNVPKIMTLTAGDPLIVARAEANTPFSAVRFSVVDPLLKLRQEGDHLVQAPGVIDKTLGQREHGAWLLLKDQGDAVLATHDLGASLRLSPEGYVSVYGTKYTIQGDASKIAELDGVLTLTVPGSDIDMSASQINLTSAAGEINLSSNITRIITDSLTLSSTGQIGMLADEIDLEAPNILVTAGQSMTIICGDAVIEITPGQVRLNAGAGKLLLNGGYPVVVAKTENTTEITSIDDLMVSTSVRAGV